MTLALIALIVFSIVWVNQISSNKHKTKTYKEQTKTNCALQRSLFTKWIEETKKDLDFIPKPDEKLFDIVMNLYKKYDIPVETFGVDLIQIRKSSILYEDLYKSEHDLNKFMHIEDEAPEIETATAYAMVKYNKVAYPKLNSLLRLLVQRDLFSEGYRFSRDSIHESDWQESEKRAKEFEEKKKKYPWL